MAYNWPGNIRELRDCILNAIAQFPDVEHLVPSHIKLLKSRIQSTYDVPSPSKPSYALAFLSEGGHLFEILGKHSREIIDYVKSALEQSKKKKNGEPNYPQAWLFMTGEHISNSSICQRNIGGFIFRLTDNEIVRLMDESELIRLAVTQCGPKIVSARKRLPDILAAYEKMGRG
jgi:hypothetical protein